MEARAEGPSAQGARVEALQPRGELPRRCPPARHQLRPQGHAEGGPRRHRPLGRVSSLHPAPRPLAGIRDRRGGGPPRAEEARRLAVRGRSRRSRAPRPDSPPLPRAPRGSPGAVLRGHRDPDGGGRPRDLRIPRRAPDRHRLDPEQVPAPRARPRPPHRRRPALLARPLRRAARLSLPGAAALRARGAGDRWRRGGGQGRRGREVKLLVLAAAYPSPSEPERAVYIENLTRGLVASGGGASPSPFEATVVAPRVRAADPAREVRSGIPVRR